MQISAPLAQLATTTRFQLATMSKHDIAGLVVVVAAVLFFLRASFKLLRKAAGALVFLLVGLAAVVVAVLLFARVI